MSTLSRLAATSQSLSLAAMEEASRDGLREADIEHLLLALTLSDQPAGQVLRNLGVTVDQARTAIEEQRVAQLHTIGIATGVAQPGPIVFHETSGYSWSRRAQELFSTSGRGGRSGDASAVLGQLVDEPSGTIADLLQRLGVTAAQVHVQLEAIPEATHRPASVPGQASGTAETFVPAPIGEVWALLADQDRMPEWDPSINSIQRGATDDTWIATAIATRPDGRRVRIKPQFRRREVTQLELQEPTLVAWRIEFPDANRSKPHTLAIRLSPATGGTQVQVHFGWERARGWRGVVATPLRPLQRMLIWLNAMQIGASIGRVFRR